MIHFGTSEVDITPDFPVVLGAYHRYRGQNIETEEILAPLKATLMYFEEGEDYKVLIINLDLIWVSESFTSHIRGWCKKRLDMNRAHILISATHTHSSPQIHHRIHQHGLVHQPYLELLKKRIKKGIKESVKNLREVSISTYSTGIEDLPIVNRVQTGFSIPRMGKTNYHSPNPERPVQHPLYWSVINDSENKKLGIILNLAVHPVFNKSNAMSPDFPGKIRAKLKSTYGESLKVQYLQGFAGDLRPHFPDSRLITRFKHLLLYGNPSSSFLNEIYRYIDPFSDQVANKIRQYESASRHEPVREENRSLIQSSEIFHVEQPRLQAHRLDIPGGPSLLAVNAEMFAEYARYLINTFPNRIIWPVGYANDMIGYLPDPQVLSIQSGYEYDSWSTFGNPAPFPPDSPNTFRRAINTLMP